jgi:membrane protein DedA with SNARE-associated domain
MIGLLCFVLAVLASPFKSKLRLEALAATTGQINIIVVVLAAAAGAIVGDGTGYMVGLVTWRSSRKLFRRPLVLRFSARQEWRSDTA